MTNYIWTGRGDGHSWAQASNWELQSNQEPNGQAPGAGDFAEFVFTATDTLIGSAFLGGLGVADEAILNLEGGTVDTNSFEITSGGTLQLLDGGMLSVTGTSSSFIAAYTNEGGGITVDSGSEFSVLGGLQVGTGGLTSALKVQAGGTVSITNNSGDDTSVDLSIGQSGSATAAVTGAKALLTESGGVANIGFDSGASLTISAGATASFAQADDEQIALGVGLSENNVGSSATVTVTGVGSSLTTTVGVVQIGNGSKDTAKLQVLAGASASFTQTSASSPTLVIGDDDSTGVVDVSGLGSTLTTTDGGIQVSNHFGTGTLDIDDFGAVMIDNPLGDSPPAFQVGLGTGSTGTAIVDDGSSLEVDAPVWLGAVGGTGSLTVSDESLFATSSDFGVGDDASTHGQTSNFYLNTGSDADTGEAIFGVAAGAKGAGFVHGGGPDQETSWTITGLLTVGDAGTGNLTVSDDAVLDIENSDVDDPSLSIGAQSTGVGTLTIQDDTTLNLGNGGAIVGDAGKGTLDIAGQSKLEVGSPNPSETYALTLGDDANSSGTVDLSDGSTLSVDDGGLVVGDDGHATLSVDDSTLTVTSSTFGFIVGANANSVGQVSVTDDNASMSVEDNDAYIGDGGTGTLAITDDGVFSLTGAAAILDVGVESNSSGTLVLSGSGSSLAYGAALTIGDGGQGDFEIDDGASYTLNDDITVAAQAGSSGSIEVDEKDSSLTANNITVGDDGVGTMTADDGGAITVDDNLVIGNQLTPSVHPSYVSVDDATSSLTVRDDLTVADDGAGSLSIDGDSLVDGATNVAVGGGIKGDVTVTDATFTLDDELIVGGQGTGTFAVELGGALDAAMQSVTLGDGEGGQGTLTVEDDSSTASMDSLTIGLFGQGALDVADGADVTTNGSAGLAELPGDQDDTAGVDGLSTWTVDGTLSIGSAGQATVSITDGGSLIADGETFVGDDINSTGKLEVDGDDGPTEPSSLSYAQALIVGDDGVGTLTVSDDGFVSFADGGTGEIDIGADPDGQGTVNVQDDGSVLEGDDLTVGGANGEAGGSGTLNISDDGKVSVTMATVTGTGVIDMDGGTLETDPITIDVDGMISGSGGIDGDIDDSGQIIASDGTLEIDDQVVGGALGGGELVIDSDGTLALEASVTSGVSVHFAAGGDSEELDLDDPLSFAAQEIDGFVAGDKIDLADFSYNGPATVVLGPTATLSLEDVADQTVNLTFNDADIGATFTMSSDGDDGTFVEDNLPCYVRGTRILTDRGEIAVEDLRIGDHAIAASGARRPIVWLGRRRIDLAHHRNPAAVRPVRVSAGAFGEGAPRRDLWLSPGHNIAFAGALMPISSLINGRSIVQIEQPSVEYWHVELETHDIFLADGLPAESYLDCGNRAAFANGGAFVEAHPDFRPRHFAETCLPLAHGGAPVAKAKARALARLEAQGFSIVDDADAHILVDGQRIEPMRLGERRLGFALPPEGRDIVLKSRVFVPAHTAEDSADFRELGLCVSRLQIDGGTIAIDRDEMFGPDWREAEWRDGRFLHRWTRGAASLPAASRLVIVDLDGFGRYWRDPEERATGGPHSASPPAERILPLVRSPSAAVR